MHYRFLNEIPKEDYAILEQIGSGTFSDIFSATHLKTNTNVALKILLKNNSQEFDKSINQEIKINKSLHHPFICEFFNEFETDHLNVIVMELIEGMTLLDYVNNTHGLPPPEVSNFFSQLFIAIEYLHNEAHITHRDLKLENIMVDNCGHIRLIDFGFSTRNSLMSTLCGSIPYCAPEILAGQVYTKASDIWSMGIILYALFNGNLPFFHHNTNILVSLICNSEVKFPDTFDGALKDLLFQMLNKDPEQRIKLEDIKNHPFVSHEKLFQIDYKNLFSPINKPSDHIQTGAPDQDGLSQTSKLEKPASILNGNLNPDSLTSQVRKSGFFRMANSTFNLTDEAFEILHEKITLKNDDIDLSIENRKNFAHNLTKLIESTFLKTLYTSEMESRVGTSLESLVDDQLSLSSSQVIIPNGPLINLTMNQPGTSDNLSAFVNPINHHYAIKNHFAGMTSSGNKSGASKPPFPSKKDAANGKPPHPTRQTSPPPQPASPNPQPGPPSNNCGSQLALPQVIQTPPLFSNGLANPQKLQIAASQQFPAANAPLTEAGSGPLVTQKRPNVFMSPFRTDLSRRQNQSSFPIPNFIARTHRRHSHNRAIVFQPPIVSPIVNHGNNINLSEE